MSRVSSLIKDIRSELADPEKSRWSDTRLLKILSQAQTELAQATRALIQRMTIPLADGQSEYFIDEDTEILLRAYTEEGIVELASHFEMDDFKANWEFVHGPVVEKLVYDLLTPNRLIVYPIPSAVQDNVYIFEPSEHAEFVGAELLGAVATIDDYSFTSPYGVVVDLFQPGVEEAFNSPFGVITGIAEGSGVLRVQYAKRPAELKTLEDDLELSSSFDEALLRLSCSKALTADIDAKANALSDKHYQLYQIQLARLKNNKAHNQVKGNNVRTINRNPYAG